MNGLRMKWWITATVMLAAAAGWGSPPRGAPRHVAAQGDCSKEIAAKLSADNGFVPSPRSTYIESILFDYPGPYASRYTHRSPRGSRGDVRAKGQWADGEWMIEFDRLTLLISQGEGS